jgi:DNA-directed RNA polymerase subunit beta'
LPDKYKITGPVTAKSLHDSMVSLAKEDPQLYAHVVHKLKQRGDEIATLEGISVGLDDIRPEYAARDAILNPVIKAFNATKNPKEQVKLVVDAQKKLLDYTKQHKGSMTEMAATGARGSFPQLMKMIGTPLASQLPGKDVTPWLVTKSYSEGLSPADYWVMAPESRANSIATTVSTAEPGEMAKVLVANMTSQVITQHDCGTHNGVRMMIDDPHSIDRYLASEQHGQAHNTLVTPELINILKAKKAEWLLVRSPMTCVDPHGVCQMCYGLNEKGHLHAIGINVGTRSAQAMAEPLTQMALGSKHAILTVKEKTLTPTGFKGVRQILEIPKIFQGEAVLAPAADTVSEIRSAPQGGSYVKLKQHKKELYVNPALDLHVKVGDHVEAGDAMTNGLPRPDEITQHKGIGAGRQYFVNALHDMYNGSGVNLDKRHYELLAKSALNHVQFVDSDPNHPEFLRGDVVAYNTFADAYRKDAETVSTDKAEGHRLAADVHHHTVGTLITPSLVKELKSHGVKEVSVSRVAPNVTFVHRSFVMNPLLDHDWLGRLAHRFLRNSIQQAAHTREESNLHGTHPVPAYAFGAEMQEGLDGGTY